MARGLISFAKQILLFSYGTSLNVANKHHTQSRMIAYTIGGLLVFVTTPFIYLGTAYLLYDEFASITHPVLHLATVMLVAVPITLAVLWVERALLVLSDAIWPHFLAHLAMFLIRVGMVMLFSVVIANKWVINSYAGPIQKELVTMSNEAQEQERKNANVNFNINGLQDRLDKAQSRTQELELKIATLPEAIVISTQQLNACKVDSMRLVAERNEIRRIADRTSAQDESLRVLEVSARAKALDCRLKEQSINAAVRAYKDPLETELGSLRTTVSEVSSTHASAERAASEQAAERTSRTLEALKMNGADQEAFARVRTKNPDIDAEVRKKTLLLAALELLPLLLKLLTVNSPIAMEARATLQKESEEFRRLMLDSIQKERNAKAVYRHTPPASPGMPAGGYASASPFVISAPPPPRAMPSASATAPGAKQTAQQ